MHNADFVNALKEALNGLRTVHMVGEEWVSYVGDIPTGGVPYCGQEVNRSTYSALWSYAQAQGLVKSESEWQSWASSHGGNVPYYSSGNGSSTFRMPRLVGYVRGASSQSESGSYVKEGLPNITGDLKSFNSSSQYNKLTTNSVASGSLFVANAETSAGQIGYSTTSSTGGSLGLDASRSSPIYGNSSHVTPETSCVLFGVYAFGEISNVGSLDASTLATGLARVESNVGGLESNKLDKSTAHIVETWRATDGSSWYRKWSDGLIVQGGRSSSNGVTVTFPVPFASVVLEAHATANKNSTSAVGGNIYVTNLTTAKVFTDVSNGYGYWYVSGY